METVVEPKFKKGDYIINRTCGDMAIVNGVTKNNYYTFKEYYSAMFHTLKDLDRFKYELQVDYQKFFDLCKDDEKGRMDEIIAKRGGG